MTASPAEYAPGSSLRWRAADGVAESPRRSGVAHAPDITPPDAVDADLLQRFDAVRTALADAVYQISQLVQANRILEVHARMLAEELSHIRRLALHDGLTGLANRALLADRLELAIAQARRKNRQAAVVLVTLNGFEAANDQHGRSICDEVLCEAARRMRGAIRACDTAARVGAEVFVIVLTDLDAREDAVAVAQKIRLEIGKPTLLAEHTLMISANVGVSVYPADGATGDALVERANEETNAARACVQT